MKRKAAKIRIAIALGSIIIIGAIVAWQASTSSLTGFTIISLVAFLLVMRDDIRTVLKSKKDS